MQFGVEFSIGKINWIKENEETKLVDIVLENEKFDSTLNFTKDQLQILRDLINEFFEKGFSKASDTIRAEVEVNFNVSVDLDDGKTSVDMRSLEDDPFPAVLVVRDLRGRELHLTLNAIQAKQIKEKFERFIIADEAFSRIRKKDYRERTV